LNLVGFEPRASRP